MPSPVAMLLFLKRFLSGGAGAAIVAGALASASAQTAPEPPAKKEPPRQVRFLALGEMPPFRQEVRDGVRYELEPPAGSIPPREVMVGTGEAAKQTPVRLDLGRLSESAPIPAGAGPFTLRKKDSDEGSAPWLTLNRPENGDLLVVCWRDPSAKSWDGVRAMVLPDGLAGAPAGSVTLLNVAPATVAVMLGAEKLAVPPGRPVVRHYEAGKDQPLQVGAVDAKGELKRFHSSSLAINTGERTWVLIYRADGVSPRQPVKVSVLRERAAPE